MRHLDIVAASGVPFRVLHLAAGEIGPNPARGDFLPSGQRIADGDSRVEIFDRRYPHTMHGQFVSDYYAQSLTSGRAGGLDLAGGVEGWTIDAGTVAEIVAWLTDQPSPLIVHGAAPVAYAPIMRALPYSEVCMHMRVAGQVFLIEPRSDGMAQIYSDDGRPFSFPITWGEAGIRDRDIRTATGPAGSVA